MKVDFVRFNATDGVELQGWLSDVAGDLAVIHIHGKSGNGYENNFLDNLREMYATQGISFLSIDTRGRGIITDFRQGSEILRAGSCFEIFEESIHDTQGAIDYLNSRGKNRIILQGHSLGCTKIVNYLVKNQASAVIKTILLAPTDMVGWARSHLEHEENLKKAKQLISEGKPEELVGAQCWVDKEPISAATYLSICEQGNSADIYGERPEGPLIGKVEIPMLIIYGTEDIGIKNIDGTIENWAARVENIKNENTIVSIIEGASHGFRDFEADLVKNVESFAK